MLQKIAKEIAKKVRINAKLQLLIRQDQRLERLRIQNSRLTNLNEINLEVKR